jgi:hypothetical protein
MELETGWIVPSRSGRSPIILRFVSFRSPTTSRTDEPWSREHLRPRYADEWRGDGGFNQMYGGTGADLIDCRSGSDSMTAGDRS